jgi:hypothetical protein
VVSSLLLFVRHVANLKGINNLKHSSTSVRTKSRKGGVLMYRSIDWQITMGITYSTYIPHLSPCCRASTTSTRTRASSSWKTAVPHRSNGSGLRRWCRCWRWRRRIPTTSSTTFLSRSISSSRSSYPAIHSRHGRK